MMESPAALCPSEWFNEDRCVGLKYNSTSNNQWQYEPQSGDSDSNNANDYGDGIKKALVIGEDNDSDRFHSKTVKMEPKNERLATSVAPIDPPFEFQDCPKSVEKNSVENVAEGVVMEYVASDAMSQSESERELKVVRSCCTPEPYLSSSSSRRPASRNSLSSRLSSSHNSLSVPTANKADDSSFITSAMSHDVLDLYNIPLDSDIYTLPIDSLRPSSGHRLKRQQRHPRKRRRNTVIVDGTKCSNGSGGDVTTGICKDLDLMSVMDGMVRQSKLITECQADNSPGYRSPVCSKRHSLPGSSLAGWVERMHRNEPIHMTLQEVRQFLHNLYASTSTDPPWAEGAAPTTTHAGRLNHNPGKSHSAAEKTRKPVGESVRGNNNNNTISDNNNFVTSSGRKTRGNNSKNGFAIKLKNRKSKSFTIESDVKTFNNKNSSKHNSYTVNGKSESKTNNSTNLNVLSNGNVNSDNSNNNNNNNNEIGNKCNGNSSAACGKNSFSYTLKQTLCNIFRFKRGETPAECRHQHGHVTGEAAACLVLGDRAHEQGETDHRNGPPPFAKRALPPLPSHDGVVNLTRAEGEDDVVACIQADIQMVGDDEDDEEQEAMVDFASSIEKVKDYGWYWGPISGETAEKILSNEPDGSFIVRDSSDDHYIFSLTFKLNSVIRHVRIEHDQGNFSFGSCAKFKSRTIVEFIENAVEHSRSGRYLFFLHRRPIHGPMRVQLLHPVSRFKQVQSLQHMCRFVILKVVRRDLIASLPLPRRIISYLNSPHYYSEHPSLPAGDEHYPSASPSLHLFSFLPPNS